VGKNLFIGFFPSDIFTVGSRRTEHENRKEKHKKKVHNEMYIFFLSLYFCRKGIADE
jgi:hypothetical protein